MKMKKNVLLVIVLTGMLSSCVKDFIGHHHHDHDDDNDIDESSLTFQKIGGFTNGTGDAGFAEISAYDGKTKKLFVVDPNDAEISVWDISNPSFPVELAPITVSGTPNSVAVNNGLLAIAVENVDKQADGQLLTFDTKSQQLINTYAAGALPDMVTFSPNGRYLISANEGEPNDDYTIDPEGSITIVNLHRNESNTLYFGNFNTQDIGNDFRVFGPSASFSQDVEPEYVAVSSDSRYAYVTLQENNGIAIVDLQAMKIKEVVGLGAKDYTLPQNTMDASDKDGIVGNFQNWPIAGFFMPDAIATAKIRGTEYLITANEGDSRDYSGYSEETRVKDLLLDETIFPNAADLQKNENLGRLKTTTANGDVDGDGDFDKIYTYGGRSFSIWDTTGFLLYDSADEIGRTTFDLNPSFFNADEGVADGRSDDKGAEPETVTTLKVGGTTLLFVGLERSGGVLIYDLSNPLAPEFIQWIFDSEDFGPEGLLVIEGNESPTRRPLLVVTNEVSNTVSIYEIR